MKPTKAELADLLATLEAEQEVEDKARIDAAIAQNRLRIVVAAVGEDEKLVRERHLRDFPKDAAFELLAVYYGTQKVRPELCTPRSLRRAEEWKFMMDARAATEAVSKQCFDNIEDDISVAMMVGHASPAIRAGPRSTRPGSP